MTMVTISPFIDSMIDVEKELSQKYGPFALFALFQRDNGRRKYDVVVGASWLPAEWTLDDLQRIDQPVQARIKGPDILQMSHISIVQPYEDGVLEINRLVQTVHEPVEFWSRPFFDKDIRHAVIITSQSLS